MSQNAVLVSSNILRLREKQSTIIVIKIIRNNGSKQSDSFWKPQTKQNYD